MKLAIDCRYVGKSGIGTFAENVIFELMEHHSEYDYLLICNPSQSYLFQEKNVKILVTKIKPFTWKEMFLFPVSQINQCDAYFSPYINIPIGIKIPIFCTIHDVIFLDRKELTTKLGYVTRKWTLKYAVWKSQSIFTVSEFSKQRIIFHLHPKKNVIVTYNGINQHLKRNCERKIPNKQNYIVYVGNIKQHKGLSILLEAYKAARKKGFDKDLVIVGNEKNFRTVDKSVTNIINNPSVKFTGYVSDDILQEYIMNAAFLILPSFYEGFGIPPLEALYLGTDVIVSDIEVLQEVYSNLPVTFFKVGSSVDLCQKLLESKHVTWDVNEIRQLIAQRYSSKRMVDIILPEIHKCIEKIEKQK